MTEMNEKTQMTETMDNVNQPWPARKTTLRSNYLTMDHSGWGLDR